MILKKKETKSSISPNGPLTALAYKVVADQKKGIVTFLRVYGGKLKSKDVVKAVGA